MRTKPGFPSPPLTTRGPTARPHSAVPQHPVPCPWSAALGRSHLPAAQKADLGGDGTAATINHSLMLLQRLQELLQNGNGSDTVLRVRTAASEEAKVFHTHQLLLSLQSEVFESLLHNQSVITLHEPPETAALFEKFIRYWGSLWDGDTRKDAAPLGTVGKSQDGDTQLRRGDVLLGTTRTLWDGILGRMQPKRGHVPLETAKTPWDGHVERDVAEEEVLSRGPWGSHRMGISRGIQPKRKDASLETLEAPCDGILAEMQPRRDDAPLGTVLGWERGCGEHQYQHPLILL